MCRRLRSVAFGLTARKPIPRRLDLWTSAGDLLILLAACARTQACELFWSSGRSDGDSGAPDLACRRSVVGAICARRGPHRPSLFPDGRGARPRRAGAGDREQADAPGLFPVAPPVDPVPPLGAQAWYGAFALHQQDPIFAACGGSENLAQFKVLYWWEWLRQASLLLLTGTVLTGFCITALWPAYRFALKHHVALGLGALGYLAAVWCLNIAVAHHADLARYNVGQ